ncbi:MAG: MNIO family bufferin maturase [Steroidobacteraceae bacterium]
MSGISHHVSDESPIPAAAGIGLRFPHHEQVLRQRPSVAWFEIHAENYFGGGAPRRTLERIRGDYPLAVHGVGLSLGSADGLDARHLQRLVELVRAIEPGLVSEHLSWSVIGGTYLADLLPLPMTEEALTIVCRHIEQTQNALRRRLLIENPSTYLQFAHSSIPECEFLAELARRTGCGILCDVNNIYVSACNHGWDAQAYLDALPPEAIGEIHLAGHALRALPDGRSVRIDNHGARVADEVWALYRLALQRFGRQPTLIEWDTDIPAFEVLLDEAAHATVLMQTGPGSDHARAA